MALQTWAKQIQVRLASTLNETEERVWEWPADSIADLLAERSHLLLSLEPILQTEPSLAILPSDKQLQLAWTLWVPLTQWLVRHYQNRDRQPFGKPRPLILGILGGQGTGKTTLTRILCHLLEKLGYRGLGLSLDDFYYPYTVRQRLRERDPRLIWRGPPGTHDVEMALDSLLQVHRGGSGMLTVPEFDKYAHQGQGDRTGFRSVSIPDILLFEGWMVGMRPCDPQLLQAIRPPIQTEADQNFARMTNQALNAYVPLWDELDHLLILNPLDLRWSYQWRQQAEEGAMAIACCPEGIGRSPTIAFGQTGMTPDQIKAFVDYFWKALHPEIFLPPLLRDPGRTDLIVEINIEHQPVGIRRPRS
jgi:D-glycerate 3-kinase